MSKKCESAVFNWDKYILCIVAKLTTKSSNIKQLLMRNLIIDQLGPKLITKTGLHHHQQHQPPETFMPLPGNVGI